MTTRQHAQQQRGAPQFLVAQHQVREKRAHLGDGARLDAAVEQLVELSAAGR